MAIGNSRPRGSSSKRSSSGLNRNTSQGSLKSNNAGYSTTNRKGVTTYYKSSKDAGGYSDVGGTRSSQSKGSPMFSKDNAGKVITSASIAPASPVVIPTLTATKVGDYTANNAGLVGGEFGVTQQGNNLTVAPETTTQPAATDKWASYINSFNKSQQDSRDLMSEQPSMADVQRKLEKETGIKRIRQDVNNYTGQLNTITANRDANILKLEGQGRGITDVIIGGQQAAVNKEAAIQALPVQAQLAAAQGNLELAQDHINTWGTILMTDATNKYNQKKELINNLRDFTTTIELKKIEEIDKANERKYQENHALISAKTAALAQALGQGASASVMNAIKAATSREEVVAATGIYNGDVLGRQIQQAQLRKLNEPSGGGYGAPTIKEINGVDYQWNPQTGQWQEVSTPSGGTNPKMEQLKSVLSLARELRSDKAVGKSGAVGFGFQKFVPWGQSLGLQGSRTAFENKVNTLKANLTLENLGLLKGPMSDKDLAFLQAVGSSLTTNMSESEFNKEIDKVTNKLQAAQGYVAPTFQSNPNALPFSSINLLKINTIVAPDGQQVQIID